MFSVSTLCRGLAVPALWAALAGTAIAGPIVVRSSGPSAKLYPAGKQLADNAQIALKAGDTLVILDGRGTRTVSGPGSFAATASGGTTRAGVSATAMRILSTQAASERRGGAVRGGTGGGTAAPRSPNLWFVDAAKSGTVCVADPTALKVWRGSNGSDAELTVSGPSGQGAVAMARGVSTGDWPATVPVADGAEYTLSGGELPKPTKIKLAFLGANPDGLESTAAQLIARGCQPQLDLLIETVALPKDSGTGGN